MSDKTAWQKKFEHVPGTKAIVRCRKCKTTIDEKEVIGADGKKLSIGAIGQALDRFYLRHICPQKATKGGKS